MILQGRRASDGKEERFGRLKLDGFLQNARYIHIYVYLYIYIHKGKNVVGQHAHTLIQHIKYVHEKNTYPVCYMENLLDSGFSTSTLLERHRNFPSHLMMQ